MSALRNTLYVALAAIPLFASATAHAEGWRAWRNASACYVRVAAQDAPAAFGFFTSPQAAPIFCGEAAGAWTASDRVILQIDRDEPIAAVATRQTGNVLSIGIVTKRDRQRLVAEMYSGAQLTVTTGAGMRHFALTGSAAALTQFDACTRTLPGRGAS